MAKTKKKEEEAQYVIKHVAPSAPNLCIPVANGSINLRYRESRVVTETELKSKGVQMHINKTKYLRVSPVRKEA